MTKCNKCGYEWETKSKMFFVSCPKCRKLVSLKDQVVENAPQGISTVRV